MGLKLLDTFLKEFENVRQFTWRGPEIDKHSLGRAMKLLRTFLQGV